MEFLFDRKCDLNYSQQFLIKFYEGLKKKTSYFLNIFTTCRKALKYQLCFMSLLLCKFILCPLNHFKKCENKNILTQYCAKPFIHLFKQRKA